MAHISICDQLLEPDGLIGPVGHYPGVKTACGHDMALLFAGYDRTAALDRVLEDLPQARVCHDFIGCVEIFYRAPIQTFPGFGQ